VPEPRFKKDGSIEFLDDQGEVTAVSKPKKRRKNGAKVTHRGEQSDAYFQWKQTKDGEHMLLPRDVNPKEVDASYSIYKNKHDLCLEIAMEIANGKTLSDLDKSKGFPATRTVFYWYARDPLFKNLIDEARKVRAEFYHDRLVDVADNVVEENARSSKVKADVYKHLMSVNDRDRFGNQTKVVGDATAPINITFNTGIVRDAPAQIDNAVPAVGRVVDDES
jgi:hypothetical protein